MIAAGNKPLCLIPGSWGIKALPRKNIVRLGGKPLLGMDSRGRPGVANLRGHLGLLRRRGNPKSRREVGRAASAGIPDLAGDEVTVVNYV